MERAAIYKHAYNYKLYKVDRIISLRGTDPCQTCKGSGLRKDYCACCCDRYLYKCHGSRVKTLVLSTVYILDVLTSRIEMLKLNLSHPTFGQLP